MDSTQSDYMTDDDIVAETKGRVTKGNLAQRRYKGLPPAFLKPTPRTVLYKRENVRAWLEGSEQTSTAEVTL